MAFTDVDRLVFARLYHLAPGVLNALKVVKPETVIRWHRAGFRAYWRRRSGPRGGRPRVCCNLSSAGFWSASVRFGNSEQLR